MKKFHLKNYKWLKKVYDMRAYLVNTDRSKKGDETTEHRDMLVRTAIDKIRIGVEMINFQTEEQVANYISRNQDFVRVLLPGESATSYKKLQTEFFTILLTSKSKSVCQD